MKRPVTLHHVAQAAGVSHTTVSMALRGDPRIKEATRQKVIEVARSLAYVPNAAARSLAQGRSETIAIVSSSYSSAFESETLRGLEREMVACLPNYRVIQYSTGGNYERARSIFEELLYGNKADGVVCLTDSPDEDLRTAFREHHRALVLFDEHVQDVTTVHSDSLLGARLAAEHLLAQGCANPGIVHGACEGYNIRRCEPGRFTAFTDYCTERGFNPRSVGICHFHFEEGQKIAQIIADEAWDGVFCAAGDLVAIGIMAGCRELGLKIPEDIKIIGYDNLQIASMVNPALSTIAQPLAEMGREAIRLVRDMIQNSGDLEIIQRIYDPKLVIREST